MKKTFRMKVRELTEKAEQRLNADRIAERERKKLIEFKEQYEANRLKTPALQSDISKLVGSCARRSVFDSKWKQNDYDDDMRAREETAMLAAEEKSKRVAPAYNKGPLMLVLKTDDPASLGRKV